MFDRHKCAFFLCIFVIEKVICLIDCDAVQNESAGVCVRIEECPSIELLLSKSPRPLPGDVAQKLETCAFEGQLPKICCYDNLSTKPSVTPIPQINVHPTPSQVPTSGQDVDLLNRVLPEDASTHRNLNLLPLTDCGEILDERISNGNKTDLYQYPWMALLRYDNGTHRSNRCGGSLISQRYVLTAAHCVTRLESTLTLVEVRLGEHDTSTDIDCQKIGSRTICAPKVQDIAIDEAIAHPAYGRPKYSNDIAIIRLASLADITPESVRPICLPTTFQVQNTDLKRVIVAGWGTTEKQELATVLLQATIPIVSNYICQTQFYKRSVQLNVSQMCAGGEVGIDSCKGDSGGPLFFSATLDNVRMVQFGIVSVGVSVCSSTNDHPAIYVKVGYYMRWILDQMRP